MDWTSIIVALVTALGALAGTYFANRRSSALIAYRLSELEKKQDKHNAVIERTYALETAVALQKDEIERANERIEKLEGKVA